MTRRPHVVIILARCSGHGTDFGIRFEEQEPGSWVADWAFAIREAAARREGYDRTEIAGTFGFAPAYPGCPACAAPGLYRCPCDRAACWDGSSRTVTCPWCGRSGTLTGKVDRLHAEGDR